MAGDSVGLIGAFVAGLVSFVSPCVLPLVPAYVSFMTGLSVGEISGAGRRTSDVLVPALLFVLGFSLVFVAMGASASVLGTLLRTYRDLLAKVAGVVIFAFGFLLLGVVKVPWLYREARPDMAGSRRSGPAAALVMGMAFAFGWTPCVGPILGSILLLAGSGGDAARGALLLTAYSAGLGVPFLVVALALGRLAGALGWLNRHSLAIGRVAGAVLMVLGILVFTGTLGLVSGWLLKLMPGLRLG
jgi:cytochrome c-type biogenesis protein